MSAVPFVITSIDATPDIPIAGSDKTVILLPGTSAAIWASADLKEGKDATKDGTEGSMRPVGFKLGTDYEISIQGLATYDNSWPKTTGCILRGSLRQGQTSFEALRATWTEEKLEGIQSSGPLILPFNCKLAISGLANTNLVLPYGFRGDIVWTIEPDMTSAIKLSGATTTRLEIYFLPDIAPGGPTEGSDTLATRVNLQGKWPVKLLRSFVPDQNDHPGKTDMAVGNTFTWWAEHSIRRIKARGSIYDAVEGRSGYNVGFTGGSLDLNGWYDQASPIVNSFDITAILEAAYTIMPEVNRQAVLAPVWVGLMPAGPIATTNFSMSPLGWPDVQGTATPFFKGLKGKLSSTSWLEVQTSNEPTDVYVAQAAFNTKAKDEQVFKPDTADIKRQDFFRRHFETWQTFSNNSNDIYTSDAFKPIDSPDDSRDALFRKVGLRNLNGVNEPWPWNFKGTQPSFIPMVEGTRGMIRNLLKQGRNVAAQNCGLINGGSLKPRRIASVLSAGEAWDPKKGFRLAAGRDASTATYIMPLLDNGKSNVRVKISTLLSFSDAVEALAVALTGFESDLAPIVLQNNPNQLRGHYMLRTAQSLLLVRNNILVDLTVLALEPPAGAAGELLSIAGKLDTYLANCSLDPAQACRPVFHIRTNPGTVKLGTPFVVDLANVEYLATEMDVYISAETSNVQQPIICTSTGVVSVPAGSKETVRTLSFLPLRKDMAGDMALDITISISGVHFDTFYPCSRSLKVTLQ